MYGSKEFTVTVPKGTKVNVKEVDQLRDEDPRIPQDRDLVISGPEQLKIAVKRGSGADVQAKGNVVTMCG